jgi:hypothetical protein
LIFTLKVSLATPSKNAIRGGHSLIAYAAPDYMECG